MVQKLRAWLLRSHLCMIGHTQWSHDPISPRVNFSGRNLWHSFGARATPGSIYVCKQDLSGKMHKYNMFCKNFHLLLFCYVHSDPEKYAYQWSPCGRTTFSDINLWVIRWGGSFRKEMKHVSGIFTNSNWPRGSSMSFIFHFVSFLCQYPSILQEHILGYQYSWIFIS